MTALECYQTFNSLRLHFTSEKYNYFTYNGKVKTSIDSFEKRKDKYYYYKLSRKFVNKEDLVNFVVPSLVEKDKVWVGFLLDEQAEVYYNKHQRVIQSLSYTFENECSRLFEEHKNPNDVLMTSGDYPLLLQSVLRNEVSIETLILLNNILKFLPMWNLKIKDDIQWPKVKMRILKYADFLPCDVAKYRMLLRKIVVN